MQGGAASTRPNSSICIRKNQDSASKNSVSTSVKDYLFNDPKKEWCIEGYTVPMSQMRKKVTGTIDDAEKPKYLGVFEEKNDNRLQKVFL